MWESFKNLSKKILIGFVALIVVLVIGNLIAKQIEKQALIIDEEIALDCTVVNARGKEYNASIILQANKRSRKTDKYWDSLLVRKANRSVISDDKALYSLDWFPIQQRTIDYVFATVNFDSAITTFRINREDFSLTIIAEGIYRNGECVQTEGSKIRDQIKQDNKEADAKNKL